MKGDLYHGEKRKQHSRRYILILDVERYMAEFKEGNFNNYEECQTVLRYLALREMNLVIEKNNNSQITSIEIPAFLVKR